MGSELLLEIGTEEIPARFLPPVMQEMAASLRKRLEQQRIAVGEIVTWATPRRLALVARDLAAGQKVAVQEIIGPPKAKAFDAKGSPTPAALGFAKAQGVAVSDLVEVDTPRGVYLGVSKSAAGRATAECLPEILPEFIMGLSFPKSMHWGSLHATFARPIHWVVALFAGQVVPFTLADVTSGAVTYGHRFLGPQAITVQDAASYVAALQKAQVLVDPAARRARLETELAQAAAGVGGEVVPNPGLLEENIFLVEYPSVVVGSFDRKFLALPDEVLITSMREHQRYFSLRGQDGKLLPHFIAVNNTLTRNPDVVRQGHQRVLRARLSDAMYFFQVDSKVPLENRVEALKGVMFHSLLGTSYEKMERFRELAAGLARQLAPQLEDKVRRAATLAKADITTEMVGEFPSLQGVMGEKYSLLTGEDPEVATALFSHYLPRHADDILPKDLVGALVGLADRLDTICGFFGVGLNPTGTADPYGLRRHALAIIRILRVQQLHLDLPEVVVSRHCFAAAQAQPHPGRDCPGSAGLPADPAAAPAAGGRLRPGDRGRGPGGRRRRPGGCGRQGPGPGRDSQKSGFPRPGGGLQAGDQHLPGGRGRRGGRTAAGISGGAAAPGGRGGDGERGGRRPGEGRLPRGL